VEEGAEEVVEADPEPEVSNLDTVWLLVAAFLVFFMQAGFALVEAGFVRARHVVNILMKNFFDLAGRVFRGAPAPTNLTVPPYTFLSDSTLLIGEDTKGA
jgi:hypothetical protein